MPAEHVTSQHEDDDLLLFLATLGSALSAIGETVDAVETRLGVSRGVRAERRPVQRLPDFVLLTLGQGQAATIEPTTRLSGTPRLDQIAAVHASRATRNGGRSHHRGIERLERSDGSTTGSVPWRASSGT